jgi:transforming growth factor-beta-induced protein
MSKVRSLLALVVSVMFVFSSVLVVGAQSATPTPAAEEEAAAEMAEMNIVETAVAAGDFQTLVAAVQAAGLVDALSGEGPFTVFAPTDAAFAALPEGTIESLLADPSGALTDILLYHVVSGQVLSSDLSDGMTAVTLGGAELTFSVSADGVQVNGANVVAADVMASNGVIHVIDAVLLPPAAEEEMVEEAAAEATPTPAAEEEAAAEATPTPVAEEEAAAEMNIVETAVAAGDFETLVAAVQAAGLVDALSGEGPFTVFAPTDAAFAALPEGTIESLLANPSGALTDILLYHVVSGQVLSSDLSDGMTAVTLGGAELTFSVSADGVQVNGANVVAADVMASNGVIHVIDAVLLPPAAEAEEMAPEATATPAAEEEAPHLLPVTGATESNSTLPWMAVLFAVVLAAGALFVRRRTA